MVGIVLDVKADLKTRIIHLQNENESAFDRLKDGWINSQCLYTKLRYLDTSDHLNLACPAEFG